MECPYDGYIVLMGFGGYTVVSFCVPRRAYMERQPARAMMRARAPYVRIYFNHAHRNRKINSWPPSHFTLGAVRTTNQSQAPALARADAGEGLAAVTGGTALRASRHPHERASRQPWDRGECRRDQ